MKKENTNPYISKGALFMKDGIVDLKEWSKKMYNEFGSEILPGLKQIYDESKYFVDNINSHEREKPETNESVTFDKTNLKSFETIMPNGVEHVTTNRISNVQTNNNHSLLSEFKPNSIVFLIISIVIILNPPYLVSKLLFPGVWSGPKFTEREFHFLFKSPQNSEIEISLIFIELILALIISILIQKVITFFFKKASTNDIQ
ncbi:MAG: hypothetical protein KBG21_02700 [Ignavibacteria bacterium]|nr:hypothetical protein [Ignavibacteria bacterium]